MSKIPTIEEFIQEYLGASNEFMDSMKEQMNDCSGFNWDNITDFMIEFARLHVEACKKEIAEDYTYYLKGDEGSEVLDKKLFNKEAYPLENVK